MRVGQSRRRDANEQAIIQALRQVGVSVFPISGEGVPDLLCYFQGRWIPLEVKCDNNVMTPAQLETNILTRFPIVRSVEEALAMFRISEPRLLRRNETNPLKQAVDNRKDRRSDTNDDN